MKKTTLIIISLALVAGFVMRHDIAWWIHTTTQNITAPPALTRDEIIDLRAEDEQTQPQQATSTEAISKETNPPGDTPQPEAAAPQPETEPTQFNLDIPFTPQAPHANWDMPYQEACEEASVLMAHWFIEGISRTTNDEADAEILALVAWENERFGYYEDTTIEETLAMLHERFGYTDAYIIENPTVDEIQSAIASGYPVIAPAAGKLLGNPYFSGDGPLYHMLVIRGYTDEQFITNDPGTRRGDGFLYEKKHLMSVIHDWNGGDVANGTPAVIVARY